MKLLKIVIIGGAAAALGLSCSSEKSSAQNSRKAEEARKLADELTEQSYDLKLSGENGKALELLQKASDLLLGEVGGKSALMASNLDDRASIYMRTGDFKKARRLFEEARAMAEELGEKENLRLLAGIDRRLETMEAMEKQGVTCSEPMKPAPPGDAGAGAAAEPYFPDVEQVQTVFAKMNERLNGCLKNPRRPVTLRMVITGRGKVVLAEARGPYYGSEQGKCLADKLMAAAPEFADDFPRFKACFRNFTYPFVVGE